MMMRRGASANFTCLDNTPNISHCSPSPRGDFLEVCCGKALVIVMGIVTLIVALAPFGALNIVIVIWNPVVLEWGRRVVSLHIVSFSLYVALDSTAVRSKPKRLTGQTELM